MTAEPIQTTPVDDAPLIHEGVILEPPADFGEGLPDPYTEGEAFGASDDNEPAAPEKRPGDGVHTIVSFGHEAALSIRADQVGLTPEQSDLLDGLGYSWMTPNAKLALMYQGQRTGLDPLLGDITPMRVYNEIGQSGSGVLEQQVIHLITIKSYRTLVAVHPEYGGKEGPFFIDEDGNEHKVWTRKENPHAVRWLIHRKNLTVQESTITYWDAVCPKVPEIVVVDGKKKYTGQLTVPSHWVDDRSLTMFAKCGEVAAYRSVMPEATSGRVYVPEEMEQAEAKAAVVRRQAQVQNTAVDRKQAVAALLAAGHGTPTVSTGHVAGRAPGKGAGMAVQASSQLMAQHEQAQQAARAVREAAPGTPAAQAAEWLAAEVEERKAWLYEELTHAAEVRGMSLDAMLKRQVASFGPVEGWSAERMLSVVGPMRKTVVAKLRTAGRTVEARALEAAGTKMVAPLDALLGQEELPV